MMKKFKNIFVMLLLCTQFVMSQKNVVKGDLKIKAKNVAKNMVTNQPMKSDPVMFNSDIVWSDDKKQAAVVIKTSILPNWHIYAIVPPTQPYIASDLILELPKGVSLLGNWEMPSAFPSQDGVYVYKGEIVFIQYLKVDASVLKGSSINSGIYYQTCDLKQCLPPKTKQKKLKV